MIKIEKRNDVPMALYFFTPFIAIILTILGGGIIFYILGFNPIAIKQRGVALSNNSLRPYKFEIGVIK